jgi:hypothetical protein
MAKRQHLEQLKKGVAAWNDWRHKFPEIQPDLSNEYIDLSQRNLTGVDLTGANLTRARLAWIDFYQANLSRADLTGADLHRANIRFANLSDATLIMADLSDGANLIWTDLTRANLTKATIGGTILGGLDLRSVRGLDTLKHQGPSMVDISTLYRSQGQIPEIFLRGIGVPEDFITYIKSLVGRPFEFYSCFISYSSKDQEFAEHLHADLDSNGVRCWFAPHDVHGGRKLHEQIDEAIRVHERLLLILSPHSMNSEWVKTEIAKARQREVREQRQVLFPVRMVSFETIRAWECFDADTGKDSAREIREYFIPDFSNWKNDDAYQEAFQRLLRDLKPNTTLL